LTRNELHWKGITAARLAKLRLKSSHPVLEEVRRPADVVYFEFCLPEMKKPDQILTHARSLAPDIVVFEHAVNSDWSYYAGKMNRSGLPRKHCRVALFVASKRSQWNSAFAITTSC
jgi:hypothetical protein